MLAQTSSSEHSSRRLSFCTRYHTTARSSQRGMRLTVCAPSVWKTSGASAVWR